MQRATSRCRRLLATIVLTLGACTGAVAVATNAHGAGVGTEPYRPAIHFTPQQNWMNDPNGLVYYRGEYHLFFQYNPSGNQWGNMSWGHAVSPDLVHWTQLPVAIPQDDQIMAFSGSVVIDVNNTTGFGQPGNPAMVAIYTAASKVDGYQRQAISYSLDNGRTFTKAGIVLATPDPQNPNAQPSDNFRDPKVFWYEAGHEWLMVAALSAQHQVVFFSSPDLEHWTRRSAFGPAHAAGGVWECPDLFPLADPANPGKQKWVLVVNLNPGGVAGGSGAQYFVGDFDGTTFTADGVPYIAPAGTSLGNFDDGTFDGWTPSGTAFGSAPENGSLPGQLPVSGFVGSGLVNGFHGGDGTTGILRSPDFVITHPYVNYLVGGGNHPYVPGSTPGGNVAGATFANFEGSTWGDGWTATGDFANAGPAGGALAGQQQVTGFDGARLVNTFINGDASQGTITSPSFVIGSHYINLLVGGGDHPWGQPSPTSVNLVVNGQVVQTATGQNAEALNWVSWDVSQYQGQSATIQIVDQNTGGWGHILADQITFADNPAPTPFANFEGSTWGDGWTATGDFANAGPAGGALAGQQQVTGFDGARLVNTFINGDASQGTITSPSFVIGSHYINLLVGGGDHPWGQPSPTSVNLVVNGQVVQTATGQNADALNWVSWDVSQYQGQSATIQIVDQNTGGWGHIVADSISFAATPASPVAQDTSVRLVVDGQVVRSATGANSETLDWTNFSVADLEGKTAHIELVDNNITTGEGAWGHLLADQFEQSDIGALSAAQQTNWLDYGADDYAAVTYNNAPGGRRILVGWMNNWNYGADVPTSPWRSAMTLPRTLSLVQTPAGLRLAQRPIAEVDALAQSATYKNANLDVRASTALPGSASGTVQRVDVSYAPGGAAQSGITVLGDGSSSATIGYDTSSHAVYIDRRNSGVTSFNGSFPEITSAPLALDSAGRVNLTIYVDRSSVEVFTADGTRVLTDTVFPDAGANSTTLFAIGGTAHVDSITVTPLAAAMFEAPFTTVPAPTIAGPQYVGYPLTATEGSWSPQPSNFAYQWSANGVDVAGATSRTFTPTAAQAGKYLTVTVTATLNGFEPTTAISTQTGPMGIDAIPPTITNVPSSPVLATATSSSGATVTYPLLNAIDNIDPHPSLVCDHASGVHYPLGDTLVTCTATDGAHNVATASFTVRVTYSWSGVLQPVNGDGSSIFPLGPSLPVIFALTGASSPIGDATAKFSYVKTSDRVSGHVVEVNLTIASPTPGILFRYDPVRRQYFFNWSTEHLTTGTYVITIDLGDGVARSAQVSLRRPLGALGFSQ